MTDVKDAAVYPEILFYHLEDVPFQRVLLDLLEKTLEIGWRAVVQASSAERLEAIDLLLWTSTDDCFFPHGRSGEGNDTRQPIFLTLIDENPNGAEIRFLIEGAKCRDDSTYKRIVHIFDGNNIEMVKHAQHQRVLAKEAGYTVFYWRRNDHGKWVNQE